ncbi:hypothetical protein [Pseudomonas sp. FP833]|uniref:hypothetical protein n=1 Tax=Pseudomonas TaxID=286 RepID=UPI002734BC1B|nr:hypothetical protein [Pseudomonas sp. FP833]WLI52210.1 hypothetical protein PSH63_05325 [Pseudomonas sp. FP833]
MELLDLASAPMSMPVSGCGPHHCQVIPVEPLGLPFVPVSIPVSDAARITAR